MEEKSSKYNKIPYNILESRIDFYLNQYNNWPFSFHFNLEEFCLLLEEKLKRNEE